LKFLDLELWKGWLEMKVLINILVLFLVSCGSAILPDGTKIQGIGQDVAYEKTPEGTVSTLVHEVQHHPVNGMPFHIDLLFFDIHEPMEVSVRLEFFGVAPAVKGNIGTLVKVLHEVEIKALPNDLPHGIEVDISVLENADSQIHASDLKLPKGVTLVTEADEVVASIAVAQEETEEAAPVDLASIEVEKKGKKEEETEA